MINKEKPFLGQVTVTRLDSRTVLWHERVKTPLLDGEIIKGEQRYCLKINAGTIQVFLETGDSKGKLFQTFDLRSPAAAQVHLCGADMYTSSIERLESRKIEIVHRVKGPRKDYLMRTLYVRLL